MVSFVESFGRIAGEGPIIQGDIVGIFVAGLNPVGASLVLVWRDPSERAPDGVLGFAADEMLTRAFTSLIIPGIA